MRLHPRGRPFGRNLLPYRNFSSTPILFSCLIVGRVLSLPFCHFFASGSGTEGDETGAGGSRWVI